MHPFVSLMRKYCIDYTNSHDQTLYDEFMRPDYVVHSFGRNLPRDTYYSRGVEQIFALAPGLGLVVHEFVLNGDRLAMHFSEHAAMPSANGRALTCWRGIGLYKWDGERLVENWVEQDYHALKRQISTDAPDPIKPPHLDPWMTTDAVPADDDAVAVVRAVARPRRPRRRRRGRDRRHPCRARVRTSDRRERPSRRRHLLGRPKRAVPCHAARQLSRRPRGRTSTTSSAGRR